MKASSVRGKKQSLATDYILRVFGLDICVETLVGSDMVRGVSGGQRKHVTTGLDSSTTYQVVKCIRNFAQKMEGTVLMALLFPPRKGVANFLQEVTSTKDQGQYWFDHSKPYVFLPVSEIADAFKRSQYGREIDTTLCVPYNQEKALPSSLAKTKYAVSKKDLLKACFSRELLLLSHHRFLYIFKTCQVAFVGFVASTMFLRTRLHPIDEMNGNLYLSCLFFGLVHIMFNGLS